jgi:hypothetical protein
VPAGVELGGQGRPPHKKIFKIYRLRGMVEPHATAWETFA